MNIAKPPIKVLKKMNEPQRPLLIVIPYWSGDLDMCRDMVRLIVDMQKSSVPGDQIRFLLTNRQDCPPDKGMLEMLKTRFHADTHRSTSPLRGYPGGANGLFASSALWIANNTNFQPDGWFWMEPDCVPMRPSWWMDLARTWKNRPVGIKIMGWKGDCNGNGTGWHITGCALYDSQIARAIPCVTMCDGIPWDYQCRGEMLKVGMESNVVHLCWRAKKADANILVQPWAVAHGYKDDSLLKLVRKKFVS